MINQLRFELRRDLILHKGNDDDALGRPPSSIIGHLNEMFVIFQKMYGVVAKNGYAVV